jgi:hypothetical protein
LFLVHRFLSPWWRRRQVPPKRQFLQEPHGVTTQKTPFFNHSTHFRHFGLPKNVTDFKRADISFSSVTLIRLSHFISLRFMSIVSFRRLLCIAGSLISQSLLTKSLYAFFSHVCCFTYSLQPSWPNHFNHIWRWEKVTKLLVLKISQTSHHFWSTWRMYAEFVWRKFRELPRTRPSRQSKICCLIHL